MERGVRTVKTLLKKAEENSEDPYLALLAYRNARSPLTCGYSPTQLTMCHTLRSTLPSTNEQLKPKLPDMTDFQEREEKMKLKMKCDFDTRHRAQTLPPLKTGDENTDASVLEKVGPRSYTVATPKGTLQRNRSQIRTMPQKDGRPQTENNANVSSGDKNTEECSSETNPDTPPVATKPNEKVISSGRISRDLENNSELLNKFDYIL